MDEWFVCDGCTHPIEGGKLRFDCLVCDNFTFCDKCYKKNTTHLHKFQKQKVPLNQGPPKNYNELIEKAYMLCHSCGESLLDMNKRVYICQKCSPDVSKGDITYFCLKCKEDNKHEHKLEKLKGLPGYPLALMNKDKD